MQILITCPAPAGTRHGNRITALRWARLLRELGHRVEIAPRWVAQQPDLLIALHARKSATSVARFHARHPGRPIVVALTGTDVYRDLQRSAHARHALDCAKRLVALQPLATAMLPVRLRPRVRVIFQSATLLRPSARGSGARFDVCVLSHLRPEKDPLRAAFAARRLPPGSRIRILQVGGAMTPGLARRARAETARNARYRWLGERPHRQARAVLARSRLLVLSSRMEGGANVISEALASAVPVLASRIPGSVGLLGADYPGYFPVGDTAALARLLVRAEGDPAFHARLVHACRRRAGITSPTREKRSWAKLLRELGQGK